MNEADATTLGLTTLIDRDAARGVMPTVRRIPAAILIGAAEDSDLRPSPGGGVYYWVDSARRQTIISCSEVADHPVSAIPCSEGQRIAAGSGCTHDRGDEESWMLKGHGAHAPFHVTTHGGHTVQTFQSLESAIEAAESLGSDHYVVDRHGLQIWNPQRKLLRNEE